MRSESKPLIAIAENDAGVNFIYEELLSARYELRFVATLRELSELLMTSPERPQLTLIDLRLDDGNALDLLETPRFRALLTMPFIIVSSLDDESVLRHCYARGAADYIVKPLRQSEVFVKIERQLGAADLKLDTVGDRLFIARTRTPLELTPTETRIVAALLSAPKRCLTRTDLRVGIWPTTKTSQKVLDTHLSNLRRKLRGAGYEVHLISENRYLLAPVVAPEESQ